MNFTITPPEERTENIYIYPRIPSDYRTTDDYDLIDVFDCKGKYLRSTKPEKLDGNVRIYLARIRQLDIWDVNILQYLIYVYKDDFIH